MSERTDARDLGGRFDRMHDDCCVLPHESADGPANMALDEAMLDAVAADPSCALWRTYGWTVPTLSLGYFQRIEDAETDPRWSGAPIVRRPTGGGAIWHDHELTYALVLPATHRLARRSTDLYRAVHGAIAELFRASGVAVERHGDQRPQKIVEGSHFLCFTGRDSEDIVASDWKVVGSAQRRRCGAVLQHGSMLLVRSTRTPELLGACDLAPVSRDLLHWSNRVQTEVLHALALRPHGRPFPGSLVERAAELEARVYRNDLWLRKR